MMDRQTGRAIDATAHIRQSVAVILTTPIGRRIMREEFGSLLPELIDQPDNPATEIRLFAAAAGAIMRWEPRLRVMRVGTSRPAPGSVDITIHAQRLDLPGRPQPLALNVPLRRRGAA
ncbi:GPW/gp25 family protein [Paracidovorax citrulli]|uniref:GPW/gp25 family protein n=1 Tax=Paracidovorax citrulli TaxID=80869 RepID=UPI0005FB5E6D